MLEAKSRGIEVRVGLLVLGALALLLGGSLWVVGYFPLGTADSRYEVAMEGSGGVRQGDRVRISGVEVGRVEEIDLYPGEEWPVIFRVVLERDVHMTEEATARIASEGLLGANYLEIDVGPPSAPPLEPGDRIYGPGATDVLAGLDAVAGRAVGLLDQVSVLLLDLEKRIGPLLDRAGLLLSDENLESISGALANLDLLLADSGPALNSTLVELERLAVSLQEGVEGLPELSAEATGLVADLRTGLGEEGERLAALLETAEVSAAAAGETFEMLSDNRERIEGTLADLESTMANLRALSQTLKDRPSALIRGGRIKDRKPGDGVKGKP